MPTPNIILVAFSTRLVDNDELLPDANDLTPPGSMKKAETIDKWREEQQEKLKVEAAMQPYSGTFDEVHLSDMGPSKRQATFKYRAADSGRQPVSLAVRSWLLREYPDAWPDSPISGGNPEVIFVGFNPKLFLRILGTECSLPCNQPDDGTRNTLPLSLWYGNSDHRDLEHAVMPSEYKLTWPIVLKARGIYEVFKDWEGPGKNVARDLDLALDLGMQLGLIKKVDA